MNKRRRVIGWSMNEISEGISIVIVRNDHYYRCYLPSESSIKRYKAAIKNILNICLCHFCDAESKRPCPHCGKWICDEHTLLYYPDSNDEENKFCPDCMEVYANEHHS